MDPTDSSSTTERARAATAGCRGTGERRRDGDRRVRTDGGQAEPGVEYGTLLETMRDGVIAVRADDTIAYVNDATERLLGIDRSTYVGAELDLLERRGILPSVDRSSLARAIEAAERGDYRSDALELHLGGDGQATTVECRIAPLPSGALDGTLVTIRDLTDRREMERELREHRDTIERLHESTARLMASRDEDELFDLTIEAARTVLSLEACAIVVDRDGDLVVAASTGGDNAPAPGDPVTAEEGLVYRSAEEDASILVEDVREREDAMPYDERYRSALSVPIGDYGVFQAISDDTGTYDRTDLRLAELLAGHVAEALERIRAERRLRERETELREERDRFAALFENVPDAVAAFRFEDGEPIVRSINGAFEETFGWSSDEVVGEDIDEWVVPPDRDDRAERLNETLLAGEQLQTTGRRRTAKGVRDFLLHVVPLTVGERTLEGYAIYTDITEQKRRERELERQNDRLDEFASIVSHDLRNPLNVAQGNLELARETGEERYFDLAEEAQNRMSRMIDELLSLARHGDVIGDRRPVEFAAVARRAWDGVATDGATLTVADEFVVVADDERLRELFENLFRNSVEHGPGSGPVAVTVGAIGPTTDAAEFDGDRAVDGFYVADDGPGIPESQRDDVFESGYTTATHGTGFGLTIVQQIAEAHDWTVDVAESEAGGARFEFRIGDGDGE